MALRIAPAKRSSALEEAARETGTWHHGRPYRERLARFVGLVVTLFGGFLLVALVLVLVLAPARLWGYLTAPPSLVQAAASLLGLGVWIYLRRAKSPHPFTLLALDPFMTIFFSAAFTLLCASDSGGGMEGRADLIAELAVSYVLVTRAAFVPSSPSRTALVSLTASCVVLPLSYSADPRIVRDGADPLAPFIYSVIWVVVSTMATTTVSRTIFGLRQEVEKAMRLGQYVLEEKIGEGGMGAVYRARHAMLRRPTAIKLLAKSSEERAVERFEREVQTTARLTHPNTIQIYDFGRTNDHVFYYVMELVEGMTLERVVEVDGPQPEARVAHILQQVCRSLAEAHAAGLVHRDIKPANVMLTERAGVRDVVKVMDFGLVKEVESPDANVSAAGIVLGTPQYMAPEAIISPERVDARADLYALGATAFYLLTGEHVFDGVNLYAVCSQHLHEPPKPPSSKRSGVSAEMDAFILRCLAKAPEARPTANEAADVLRALPVAPWTEAQADAWWARRVAPTGPSASPLLDTVRVTLADRA